MRRYLYDLWFVYVDGEGYDHSFHIGYFSSFGKVKETIDTLKDKPGFCDHPLTCFEYARFGVELPSDAKKEDLCLYVPWYEHENDDGTDEWAVFGAFVSKKDAERELEKQKRKKEYRTRGGCFSVDSDRVDLVGWQEGFTRY